MVVGLKVVFGEGRLGCERAEQGWRAQGTRYHLNVEKGRRRTYET